MPSKKKKYNARFPAGRIKKIMQTDEEVGKVAQAVPVIISRTLELFVESLIKKSMQITMMKNARTLSPHHMKLCILSESRFDFLRELVKGVPEVSNSDDDTSLIIDTSASLHSTVERRSSRETDVTEPRSTCETEPPVVVNRPSFYTEIEDSVGKAVNSPGSASGVEALLDPTVYESKSRFHSDDDTDSQSTDGSALVVSSIPDQNCSTSCDINDEDYNT